ncbi:MAG TPA: hypothetical protein VF163_19555 [Micromonosporaceae bacterium]
MKFDATVTTSLPALVTSGAALVLAGWAGATLWPLARLKRLRNRNLRIIADLRRLTEWTAPVVHREPGNWYPYSNSWNSGPVPTAAEPVAAHLIASRPVSARLIASRPVAAGPVAAELVPAAPPVRRATAARTAGEAVAVTAGRLLTAALPWGVLGRIPAPHPRSVGAAVIPTPRPWLDWGPVRWPLAGAVLVALATARTVYWAGETAHRLLAHRCLNRLFDWLSAHEPSWCRAEPATSAIASVPSWELPTREFHLAVGELIDAHARARDRELDQAITALLRAAVRPSARA